jgi:hypothetical protein
VETDLSEGGGGNEPMEKYEQTSSCLIPLIIKMKFSKTPSATQQKQKINFYLPTNSQFQLCCHKTAAKNQKISFSHNYINDNSNEAVI